MIEDDYLITIGDGLADLLTAAGVENVVVGPIVNAPDVCTGVTPYLVDTDETTGDITVGVQTRHRGGKNAGHAGPSRAAMRTIRTLALGDPFDLPNGMTVSLSRLQSSAPMGLDGATGRTEFVSTFYLRCDRIGLTG